MTKSDLRAELRIAVNRKGALTADEEQFPCIVHDMSERGVQVICIRPLLVGQLVHFRCELFPRKVAECVTEVVHVGELGIGMKIVEIDNKSAHLIQEFLQERISEDRQKK